MLGGFTRVWFCLCKGGDQGGMGRSCEFIFYYQSCYLGTHYYRAWAHEGPREFEWMKNLHVVLHDMQCNMSHGLLDFALSPTQRDGSKTTPGDHST